MRRTRCFVMGRTILAISRVCERFRYGISFANLEKRYTTEKTHIEEERYSSVEVQPGRNLLARSRSMHLQYAVVEREVEYFLEDNFVMDKQF